jgi:signal peptidase II
MLAAYRSAALGLGTGAFALAVDQLSKRLALVALHQHSGHISLSAPVDLTLVINQSNAFGVVPVYGEVTRWVLITVSFVVAVFLIAILLRNHWPKATAASFGFIMAGAVGNALDRLHYGFVIDFVDATKIGFHWVFNIADVSIDIGAALFVWSLLKTQRPPRPEAI